MTDGEKVIYITNELSKSVIDKCLDYGLDLSWASVVTETIHLRVKAIAYDNSLITQATPAEEVENDITKED